jgi:hypothetical protein
MKNILAFVAALFLYQQASASTILIPMDEGQTNHLKAYGIAFWILQNDIEVEWLLNYRGGAFMVSYYEDIEKECSVVRGVNYEVIADVQANQIRREIGNLEVNQQIVKLEKSPKIAVYSPEGKQPWDDAVTLVLTYAEIPYTRIYDRDIVLGELPKYDWLHLHHEDFTGQYGKFYRAYKNADWYQQQVRDAEAEALSLHFNKVSDLKLSVATKIQEYTAGGGFLFTMCSGTDSYDIALAAHNTDICESMYDGDAADPTAQSKLDYNNTLAFKDFMLHTNPLEYEFSSIDATTAHQRVPQSQDYFTLFEFSAKSDVVPTMLNQNHTRVVKGFMGQTTSFHKQYLKSNVLVLGQNKALSTAKYVHGDYGNGQWTFYGGHDPEDYQHFVGDPPTDLNLHPQSPGYRLILNNILFPAARKIPRRT